MLFVSLLAILLTYIFITLSPYFRRLFENACPSGSKLTVLKRDEPNFWPKLRRFLPPPPPPLEGEESHQILQQHQHQGKKAGGDFGGCYSGRSLAEAATNGDVR